MTISHSSSSVLAALVLLVGPAAAQDAAPPPRPVHLASGSVATLIETIWESGSEGRLGRYRFLVPAIARATPTMAEVEADLVQLCREQAVPHMAIAGQTADRLVISMSAEAIAFGDSRPDVTQFFEAFVLQDGDCMVEVF